MSERILIKDLKEHINKEISISGWINVRRDQGKLVFLDMRDMSGLVQCVVLPKYAEVMSAIKETRSEWVLRLAGIVNKRPEENVKAGVMNGDIELEVTGGEVLNKSETPPFDVTTDTLSVDESLRLKYRYLDLRTHRMQRNIRMRDKIISFFRDYMHRHDFVEVETPIMMRGTPEGSREYVVPSRLEQGKFYVLPQSPQQFKQLLMVGGFEKYFQIARCMRDEDTRGDRQPEFTQLDLEMSFVNREDVMALNEKLLIDIMQNLYPNKKIQEVPFPRITYKEAMEKYGTDRPDIRTNKEDKEMLAFCWVIVFPFFERTDKSDNPQAEGEWTFTHNPFSRPQDEHMDMLMNKKDIGNILTTQYDVVLNGSEIGGGSIRNHQYEPLQKVFEILGHKNENIEK